MLPVFPQTFWGHSVDIILVLEHCEMPFSFWGPVDLDNLCRNAAAICWEKIWGPFAPRNFAVKQKEEMPPMFMPERFALSRFSNFAFTGGKGTYSFLGGQFALDC